MMTGIVLAAALMPLPAAAQASADKDAMCFVAMTALLGRLSDHPDQAAPDMPDRLQRGIGFYTGRLTQRYPGPELATQIKGAAPAVFALSFRQQMDLVEDCDGQFRSALTRLVAAVQE